ncbi:MAG: hypothetical protein Q8R96_11560 [Bacteroidota bacterium]|nr:hypothetical protein [Bacteroidota bacterium]
MERLNFSTNWNKKLDCDTFSTIRLWNPEKHHEGREVDIYDKTTNPPRFKGRGKYELVSKFKLHQLKPAAAMLDTGYSLEETLTTLRTMYFKTIPDLENQPFAYIIVKKIKQVNTQNTLGL